MADTTLLKPDYATKNMRLVGHSDQGGKSDGVQIMVHRGYAYIGHIFSKGFSVVDVRDPAHPKYVKHVAAPPNTWTLHLQAHDDLLLVIHNKDMFAQPELSDEKAYYKGSVDHHAKPEAAARNWSAGMAVYDLSKPEDPKQIGFLPVEGTGLHRLWYIGGRWAYASALLDGFSDYILITIDMADPKKPVLAGKYWLPGMNVAAGEKANWPTKNGRFGCITPSSTTTSPIAAGATPASPLSTSRTRPIRNSSSTRFGRRRSEAARTTRCRCPSAICSSSSTRPCSTIRRTGSSRSGSSTIRSRPTRSASRPSLSRRTRIISRSAVISDRTTFTKIGRAASSARS